MKLFSKIPISRDPIWQLVVSIIALLVTILSIVVAIDIYHKSTRKTELRIDEGYFFNPLQSEGAVPNIKFLVNDAVVNSLRIYNFSIYNIGQNPILPEDFVEPLTVSVNHPWEISIVDTSITEPSDIQVLWTTTTTNTVQLTPLLLNPEDYVSTVLFLTSPTETSIKPELKFNGRIVGVQSLRAISYTEPQFSYLMSIGIMRFGVEYYLLLLFAIILFGIGVLLGNYSTLLTESIIQISFLTLLAVVSFIGADFFVAQITGTDIWSGSEVALILYTILIIVLVSRIITKRNKLN